MFDILTVKASRGVFPFRANLPDLAQAIDCSSEAHLVTKTLQASQLAPSGIAFLVVRQRDSADLCTEGCVQVGDRRVLYQCGSF